MTVRQRGPRTATASWHDYLITAQWLDALCAAPAGRPGVEAVRVELDSARTELAEVRAELARQRVALAGRGPLTATPTELATARAEVTGDLMGIRDALDECRRLIVSADLLLAHHRPWRRTPRADSRRTVRAWLLLAAFILVLALG